MKALEEKILKEGQILPGNILKVDSFLNHQVDPEFLMEMGQEVARLYAGEKIDRVLTIESSGIPLAFAVALTLKVPMVFLKKNRTGNLSGELYTTMVRSYTQGIDYTLVVEKKYIRPGERVLLVDDFLANGKALEGMRDIVQTGGAEVVGAVVAIEKGFQKGGNQLRKQGMRVDSLAIVESMGDHSITFREN